jgi:hypothetical protein
MNLRVAAILILTAAVASANSRWRGVESVDTTGFGNLSLPTESNDRTAAVSEDPRTVQMLFNGMSEGNSFETVLEFPQLVGLADSSSGGNL